MRDEGLARLMADLDTAEDTGNLEGTAALAQEGLALAIAAGAADYVVDFYAALARRRAFEDDWTGLVEAIEPGLAWLPRANDPVACVRMAGMLAIAYASLHQIDRAFSLLRRVRLLPCEFTVEANYLLALKFSELNLHLGRTADAAIHLREAMGALQACTPAQRTPHRHVISRLLLASALLLNATAERAAESAGWASHLDDILVHLDDAEPLIPQVQVLSVSVLVARGYCLALLGRSDPALKAAFTALSDREMHHFLAPSLDCLFAWISLEACSGDVAFARAALVKTDPLRLRLPWQHQAPLWFGSLGDVLAAEGDLKGAVEALRRSIVEDRRNRERQVSLVVAMAERAAQVDEIEERERAALDRAEGLALSNESLVAETRRLSESAFNDALTGLRNRRHLEQFVAGVRSGSQAEIWTIVMIDIDHFKSVNDQHSHAVGDKVLAVVAGILGAAVRDDDIAARWGGEEFVLLLRHRVGEPRLDAIRLSVASFDWSGMLPGRQITISLGAAAWDGESRFENALALADERLYAAKRAGRNRVVAA